jgi:hypothetical protein
MDRLARQAITSELNAKRDPKEPDLLLFGKWRMAAHTVNDRERPKTANELMSGGLGACCGVA